MPTPIRSPDPDYVVDTAPAHRWEYGVLAPQGGGKLRGVVEAIKNAHCVYAVHRDHCM